MNRRSFLLDIAAGISASVLPSGIIMPVRKIETVWGPSICVHDSVLFEQRHMDKMIRHAMMYNSGPPTWWNLDDGKSYMRWYNQIYGNNAARSV